MKAVLFSALALALLSGCAATGSQPQGDDKVASAGKAPLVCSTERRTGSHVSSGSCITAEQAKARHEASMRSMRAARQAKPAGGVAGQN